MKTKTLNLTKSLIALTLASVMALPAFAAGVPDNVSGVTASGVDSTSIGVTWNAALDGDGVAVDHYRIYYGDTSVQQGGASEYGSNLDTPNNNTYYVVTDLEPDTTYYFSVTAIDAASTESEAYSIETSGKTSAEGTGGEEDTTAPTVTEVSAIDQTHASIKFSEAVTLPIVMPESAFAVTEQINPNNSLEVISATLDTADTTGATVILETAAQTKNVNYIITAGVAITDVAGNPIISGNTDSGVFLGSDTPAPVVEETVEPVVEDPVVEPVVEDPVIEDPVVTEDPTEDIVALVDGEEDTTPPEDVTNLILSFKAQLEKFIIVMDWTASIDSAKDLVDQVMYQSMDRGVTYDDGTSLGAEAVHHELNNMEGGKEYTFKLTTKDDAGNESVGMVKSIRLPQTGLGVGFLLFGSAAAAGRLLSRKRKY